MSTDDRAEATVPAALVKNFERPGYKVAIVPDSDPMQLLVTRARAVKLKNDPGALAPHADHPFTMQERKNLKGIVAAYEASRK